MENPRHLSGSRIRPGTVIERSQIKFVIFKMQEDVNGVLARMINTSACKQPSNVSTLRCKMNRCKAPLIANIPWAQSPFLPRRAVITTAVPSLSSLAATAARAGLSTKVTQQGEARALGDILLGICFSWVQRRAGCAVHFRAPPWAWVWGCGEVQDSSPGGSPQHFHGLVGTCRAGPHLSIVNTFVCMGSIIFISVCIYAVSVHG